MDKPKRIDVYAERQIAKRKSDAYRETARLRPGVASVTGIQPMHDGAFVEVTIWVPDEEVQNVLGLRCFSCAPECGPSCKGECGCTTCHDAYADFLSAE